MIGTLMVLVLACQDGDAAVNGQGRRTGGDYELTVKGSGKGMQGCESVGLRFRRLTNRLNWSDGALVAGLEEGEVSRTAPVEKGAFTHHERFSAPGEVELRIGLGEDREIRRVFRVSTPSEEANAIKSSAKSFDGALRGVRLLLEDIEAVRGDPCVPGKRRAQLQKRIDWRRAAYRQEIADSLLAASARALTAWITDVDNGVELERAGRDLSGMVSSLTGEPFSWAEAESQLGAIEAASLRERALLLVKTAEALVRDAGSRPEKEVLRTMDSLQAADQESRTGPAGDRYVAVVEPSGDRLEDLLMLVREYLQSVAGGAQPAKSMDDAPAERGRILLDRAAAVEAHLRAPR